MKGKILVVGGDPLMGNLLEMKIAENGFYTEFVPSGETAIVRVFKMKPDAVVSETRLLDMDGIRLRSRLREDPTTAGIPFVFITVSDDIPEPLEGMRLMADDFLIKPFTPDKLTGRIARVIKRAQRAKSFHLKTDFEGTIEELGISDILPIIELNCKSGELTVSDNDSRTGRAYFREGRLISAEMGTLEAEEAFYHLMTLETGTFRFKGKPVNVPEQITVENALILQEGRRLIDNERLFKNTCPDTNTVLALQNDQIPPEIEEKAGRVRINRIIRMIIERRTVGEILQTPTMSSLRAGAILADLLQNGNVTIAGDKTELPAPAAKPEPVKVDIDEDLVRILREFEGRALTGRLEIRNRPVNGAVFFQDGQVVHAEHGNTSAKKALFRIFAERGGRFEFEPQPIEVGATIDENLNILIEEGRKELEALKKLKGEVFDNRVRINPKVLEQSAHIKNNPALKYILPIVRKHGRIQDIFDASRLTDLQTYKHLQYMVKIGILNVEVVKRANIRIVTDSSADLPQALYSDRDVLVLPIGVSISGNRYKYDADLRPDSFYRLLEDTQAPPTVNPPLESEFIDAYRMIIAENDILGLFTSETFLSSGKNARAAAENNAESIQRLRNPAAETDGNPKIEVVTTGQISMGLGFLVLEAIDRLRLGWPVDRIRKYILSLSEHIHLLFFLESPDHLNQWGRVAKSRTLLGNLFGMRPVIGIKNGELNVVETVRGQQNAPQRLLEAVRQRLDNPDTAVKAAVLHGMARDKAEDLKSLLADHIRCESVIISTIGPTLAARLGPGALGVAFYPLSAAERLQSAEH
jgi:DegV family protein with EDD domain